MRTLSTALLAVIAPILVTSSHTKPIDPKNATMIETAQATLKPQLEPLASPLPQKKHALDPDLRCLALNIYHEARSEPESGQIAVARVTLNRVESEAFPESICSVVKQGGQKRHRCQFSWWCDGKPDDPKEQRAWKRSLEISRRVLADEIPDPTNGALYYHTDAVSPKWSRHFQRTTRIGRHLFYRPIQS